MDLTISCSSDTRTVFYNVWNSYTWLLSWAEEEWQCITQNITMEIW